MTTTMTWVGLDVHARSTHAAAIDRESGELTRMRFGTGAEPVLSWLQALPQPIHACYEAGHRASKLLLRYGRVYEEGSAWTQAHRRWLAAQRFEHVPTELAYLDALAAIDGLLARRSALDERLSLLATEPELWPTVARLRCFRGIETLSALALSLEVGDWRRFERPTQLSAWLGLVLSLHQSGESESRGAITKTGSGYARRILVEAAWHYLREPRIGVTLASRQQGQPDQVLQIGWRAQHRLYRLHRRLRARGKPGNVCAAAVARELACFLWAAAGPP